MSDTQLIKDKLDIVDFVSEYVQLKPAGVNHKGLCPFHHEKTPSFMVNRERQSWHCFGCSKGGDIFSFVQEIEGMEFVEALRLLAERAGVPLTFRSEDAGQSSQRTRIKDINVAAARFWHNFLLRMPQSKAALDYLHKRGLKDETIEAWMIGFIPEQWDLLTQYLLKKGHSIDDLVAAGLTIQREGASLVSMKGFYDRFRGRIMFPIWDVHGAVVGFTGRVLVETEHSGGKYVNTPQTAVYDKSRVVFGLNKAKQEIKSKNLIVMVEGQMDVIACHQAGMTNVVAASGTALTDEQVKLLKRYSSNLNIAFDADAAGQAAAKRGIDLALAEGMNIRVIQIPEGAGKDPDECLQKNPPVWFQSVQGACHIMQWYLDKALRGKDLSDPKQKQAAANEVLPEVSRIPYAVERDHWLRELSSRLGVDTDVLREDLQRIAKKKETRNWKLETSVDQGIHKSVTHGTQRSRLDTLIERLFVLLIRFQPPQFPVSSFQFLDDYLSTHQYVNLYIRMKEEYTKAGSLDINKLRESFISDNATENIIDLLLMKADLEYSGFEENRVKGEIENIVKQIKEEWVRERRQTIQRAIAEAERAGVRERVEALMREFQSLS